MYSQRFDNNQFSEEFRGIPPASNPINTIQLVLEFHRKRIVRYLGVRIIKKTFILTHLNIFKVLQVAEIILGCICMLSGMILVLMKNLVHIKNIYGVTFYLAEGIWCGFFVSFLL